VRAESEEIGEETVRRKEKEKGKPGTEERVRGQSAGEKPGTEEGKAEKVGADLRYADDGTPVLLVRF